MTFCFILVCFSLTFLTSGCSLTSMSWNRSHHPVFKEMVHVKMLKRVLDNGLTVILIENRKLPLFSLFSFVKVGSRHEGSGLTGVSHYLEHLMFKGSKNYAAGEFEKIIIGNGGNHNAYTTRDLTVYYEALPIYSMDKILDLEADRLFHLLLEKESFIREKSVILEERKYRTENSPQGQLFLEAIEDAYRGTPYSHPPIGFIKDIKGVTQEQVRDYFETYYDPANIVIVLSGDFDRNKLMNKVAAKFGHVSSRGKFQKVDKKKEDISSYRFKTSFNKPKNIELHGNSPYPMFMVVYPGYPRGHAQNPALDILARVLGSGKSSYFNQKYVYGSRAMLSNFYAFNYDMQKSGTLIFGGQLLKGKKIKSFRKNLRRDLKNICKRSFTFRDIEKVKNQYLVNYFGSFETNSGLATLVGQSEVYYRDAEYFKRELREYLKVTSEQVRGLCKDLLEKKEPIVAFMWSQYKKKGSSL